MSSQPVALCLVKGIQFDAALHSVAAFSIAIAVGATNLAIFVTGLGHWPLATRLLFAGHHFSDISSTDGEFDYGSLIRFELGIRSDKVN